MRKALWAMILCFLLASCSFAPPYQQPPMPIPVAYQENVAWVRAHPSLDALKKDCPWWQIFKDPVLTSLEEELSRANPNLLLAYSRFEEARALVEAARSQLYPTILLNGGQSRQKNSKTVANSFNQRTFTYNTTTLQAYLTYEIDAWGAIRNTVAASYHAARASQFDLAAMDLSLHAELASIYFELRGRDAAQIAYDGIVAAYAHALRLMRHLHQGGAVSALEEDQAVNQLEVAKTASINNQLMRAKLQHAIAVLVGKIPAHFTLAARPNQSIKFVTLSPSTPSTLLIRRPDVAAAIQRMQSANASIGVARAAFFPQLTLPALMGYQSKNLSGLFATHSLIWALGPPSGLLLSPPEVSQVIFDGYYLQANLRRAKASYYETVNQYRQVVLRAFQEVEDGLVEMYRLNQEYHTQLAATKAASRALYQSKQRMAEGMDTYLGVVNIENEQLDARLALINLMTQRQLASIYLIKALGGGWKLDQAMREPV